MSRPGAYIITKTGARHEVLETIETIQSRMNQANGYMIGEHGAILIELHDYDDKKKILLSLDGIESIREGGY